MTEVKKLGKGSYILHKNEPYIVKLSQTVVTGTHTHTKVKLTIQGLFSRTNDSVVFSPHETVEEVDIVRKKAQILSKQGASSQIMDLVSFETKNAEIGPDLENEIKEGDEITYIEFNNKVKVIEKR